MPADLLCIIFEEDFRFWPQGEDPDGADDYKKRINDMRKRRSRSRSANKIKLVPRGEPTAPSPDAKGGSSSSGAYRPETKGKEKEKKIVTQLHYTSAGIEGQERQK